MKVLTQSGFPSSRCLQHTPSSPHFSLLGFSSFIMPRGHKSKRCARQKCPLVRGDKQSGELAQEVVAPVSEAAAAEVEVAAAGGEEQQGQKKSSFSQSPCGAASCSPPLTPQRRSPSTGALSAGGSIVSSDKVSSCKHEEWVSLASGSTDCFSEDPACLFGMLERFMLQKYHLKQPFSREELLASVSQWYRHEIPEIFITACDPLEMIFAIELIELGCSQHTYKFVSMLKLSSNGRIRPGWGYFKTRLLLKILTVILMKDHCAAEEYTWKFLKKIQLYPGKSTTCLECPSVSSPKIL